MEPEKDLKTNIASESTITSDQMKVTPPALPRYSEKRIKELSFLTGFWTLMIVLILFGIFIGIPTIAEDSTNAWQGFGSFLLIIMMVVLIPVVLIIVPLVTRALLTQANNQGATNNQSHAVIWFIIFSILAVLVASLYFDLVTLTFLLMKILWIAVLVVFVIWIFKRLKH